MESGKPGALGVSGNGQKKNAPSGTQYKFSDHKIPTYEELTAKPDIQVVDIRGRGVGRIAEQRKQFLNSPEAQQLYEAPVINRDTGEPVFITPHTLKHTFSNMGFEQINAGKHLKEIIENAVLTHVEEATHGSDNVTGVYTLFGTVQTEQGVQPVKLKVKEYIDDGRSLPQFIKQYFERNDKQDPYASAYDGRVLELESIEKEETSSSALTLTESNSVRGEHPSVSSAIRVADLHDLVNNEYQKYFDENGAQDPYASAYDGSALELESIEKEEVSSSVLTGTEINSVQGRYPSTSSAIRVADLYDLVNNEYQKYLPAKMTAGVNEGAGASVNDDIDTAYSIGDMQKRRSPMHRRGSSNSPFGSGALSGVQGTSSGNSIRRNQSESNTQIQTAIQMQQNAIQEVGQDAGNVGQGNTQTGQKQGTHTQEQGTQGASQPETRHKVGGSESINDIIARNREQSDTIRKLKRQLRDSRDGVLTDPKQVKGLVNSLLTDYSSRMGKEGKARITAEVQEIFDDIANNTTGSGEIHTRIRNVACEIIEHSAVLNTGTEQDYKALKAYLKNTKLTISEQDRADITDYNSFRRSLFGTIDLRNEGVPVDVAYMELTETFGEGLFPSDVTHPAEQLVHIKETMAALKPVFENPHSRNMGEATRLLADEIYERFFTLSEHPTRGRQQQRQLETIPPHGRANMPN